jgi:hypothetical protein
MPSGFVSGYLLAGHVKTSQRFAATLQKTVIFQCSVQLCHIRFPLLNKSMYSHWVKVAIPPLQPLTLSVLQCLIIGIMVSSQAFFDQTSDNLVA